MMNRLNISTRLAAAFAALVLLLAVLGSVALVRSASQRAALDDILATRLPITHSMAVLSNGVNAQAIQLRNLALSNSEAITRPSLERLNTARELIAQEVPKLERLIQSEQGREIHARMTRHRAAFLPLINEFLALTQKGDRDAALALLEDRLRPVQLAYQQTIDEQVAQQARFTAQAGERAAAAASALQRDVLIAAAVAVALAIFLAVAISRSITRPLAQAVAAADRVAAGDLGGEIAVQSADETGRLLGALQRMQHSLAATVSAVRGNAEGVASASAQIGSGNNDLSARTEEQASALEETAASMEELGSTVQQNADNARQANQLAVQASAVAQQGGEAVAEVVQTMKGINDSSQKIADIIGVIDGIAFQTNILALNAALEAARAGDQGRGFAVVAGEVRSLAQRSASAAKEIKQLITDSVERVGQGSLQVDKAGATMTEVVASIRRVTDLMGEISAASSEQAAGVGQVGEVGEVGEAMVQMDQTTQQNAALVEEMAAAASALNAQAGELVDAVAVFKLDGGAPQPQPVRAVPRSAVRSGPALPAFQPKGRLAMVGGPEGEWGRF